MAEQCYNIPLNYLPWAVMSTPDVLGYGELTLPDGTEMPGGNEGTVWTQTLYIGEG
jgi:hypothetical protein